MKYIWSITLILSLTLCVVPVTAQDNNTYINHAARFAVSLPLRDLAKLPLHPQYNFHEADSVHRLPAHNATGRVVDIVEQNNAPAVSSAYSIGANFLGLGQGFPGWYGTWYPPDSNIAVGDTQIVQWVNVAYTVCQKNTLSCSPVIAGNSLWAPLGGMCAQYNSGDIIVQWDVAAHRWLLAQNVFASPYAVCVAVSTSSDAMGSYYLYQFPVVGTGDPDYPKWGIWSTGYFQSYNSLFGSACLECAVACAYNSAKMLVGDKTAEQICHAYANGDSYLLPADRDSLTSPPDGEDEFYIGGISGYDNSHLSLYSVHINNQNDWSQGATFTGDGNSQLLTIAPFNPSCNNGPNLGGDCVPQKGVTDKLDSLGGLMYRFTYWNDVGSPADFTISALPASLSVVQGNQGTSTITTAISGGFNSAISLSASGMPTGTTVSFNPQTIPAPGSGNSVMTITVGGAVPAGVYPITVTGNGGGVQETTTVTLTVTAQANFAISVLPASLSLVQGTQGTSAITTAISGGFSNAVSLSNSDAPCGVAVMFNPQTIPAPGSGSSTLTIAVGNGVLPGTYPITVVGNGAGIQQSVVLMLTVAQLQQPNFTIAATPASFSVQQGSQGTSTITTTITGGFNNSISLSSSGMPSGTTVSFNPGTIPAPGAGNSTMSVAVGASTPTGVYPIVVAGNGGGIQQTATVTLTVTPLSGKQSFGFGFDLRATKTFVTDPSGDIAVLNTTAYPTTVGGVTFGWVKTSLVQSRDRNATIDPRLAGINFVNNGTPATFYVDLPSPGTYNLSLAMGDEGYTQCYSQCQVQFLDGNTVLATVTGGQITAGYFYDAKGNKWSAAAWPTSNLSQQVTLSGTRLTVVVGTRQSTGDFTTIAFLGVAQASGSLSSSSDVAEYSGAGAAAADTAFETQEYTVKGQSTSPAQHWLVSFDVTASGGNIGPRWMEITAPTRKVDVTVLSVFQQGTYAPDGNWRWMSSVARDKVGNILLGYSESCGDTCPGGTAMYPSIYVAGRQATDALGTLESEIPVVVGSGSQPATCSRWGDYSSMRIDQDGCTFWYTQEYYLVTQTDHWSTQIASVKFPNCN